ncbi:hypothetical protein H4N58_03970 [Mumia sp. ZJ1417]|uniref:hypothetical protein n=1 Tax=Mumia sp. ZJ1417 TaxID=2708082 RepID=UPI00141EA585|nr:hypothetical protein [Mumia sp. ZJ1417]QMW67093.1 hypothetical protein H4N58_03970 [Mumia sp. ZJ1417]
MTLADGGSAEVDFWPLEGLVVEIDGMLKYVDQPGGTTAQARIRAEKRREPRTAHGPRRTSGASSRGPRIRR